MTPLCEGRPYRGWTEALYSVKRHVCTIHTARMGGGVGTTLLVGIIHTVWGVRVVSQLVVVHTVVVVCRIHTVCRVG